MSYVRFGWGPNGEYPGSAEAEAAGASNLYLFGTRQGSTYGIECCGCILGQVGNIRTRFPFFTELDEIVAHLDAHRNAGHVVHNHVQPAIEADFEDGHYLADWVKAHDR